MTRADRIRRRLLGADWPTLPRQRTAEHAQREQFAWIASVVANRPAPQPSPVGALLDGLEDLRAELCAARDALALIAELANTPASDGDRLTVAVGIAREAGTCPCWRRGPASGPIRHHRGCEHRPARPDPAEDTP